MNSKLNKPTTLLFKNNIFAWSLIRFSRFLIALNFKSVILHHILGILYPA